MRILDDRVDLAVECSNDDTSPSPPRIAARAAMQHV